MCKIIAFVSGKGGVGKTTSTINLSAYMKLQGKKVCMIDLDPQRNLTNHCGIATAELKNKVTICDIFYRIMDEETTEEEISELVNQSILSLEAGDLIPSSLLLEKMEDTVSAAVSCEHLLEYALQFVKHRYDYILIDCHNGYNVYVKNALACCDSVLLPTEAEDYSCNGISDMLSHIRQVRKLLNPKIEIDGVFIVKYRNTSSCRTYLKAIENNFSASVPIFPETVPLRTRVTDLPSFHMSLFDDDPNSDIAKAYASIGKRVMSDVD